MESGEGCTEASSVEQWKIVSTKLPVTQSNFKEAKLKHTALIGRWHIE